MLKQSPSKTQRTKGFKVKHAIQICLLLTICIWLLYQVKRSHEKKRTYEETSKEISEKMQNGHELIKLGRKDLDPLVEERALGIEGKEEFEQEVEDSKREEREDEGRGGGDDEIDGHDQESIEEEEPEEVEDLIDEEDREGEERSEGKGSQMEEVSFSEDQDDIDDVRNSQEAREEHYKGDDASSAVVHNTQTMSNEFAIGGLRKVKQQQVENAEKIEVESENIKDSDPELSNEERVENGAFGDAVPGDTKGSGFGFSQEANANPEVLRDLSLMLTETDAAVDGKDTLPSQVINISSSGRQLFLQAVSEEESKSAEAENQQSDVNFTLSMADNLDATIGKMAVLSSSGSVMPTFDASSVSEERSASAIAKENDFTEDSMTEEGSVSLTTNEKVDATRTESLGSSDPSFYREHKDDDGGDAAE